MAALLPLELEARSEAEAERGAREASGAAPSSAADGVSLTELAAENRRKAALLRQRLALVRAQEEAAGGAAEEEELKSSSEFLAHCSLATLPPAQIQIQDLTTANLLHSAELRYLMASRRLQTLMETGVPYRPMEGCAA